MGKLVLLFIFLPQLVFCQQIDFISHDKVNIVATFSIEKDKRLIMDNDGSKKEELISIDTTTFGMFVYSQELSDSLFLFIDKTPKMILGIQKFNWFISKDGAWNLLLDTNDPSILSLFIRIEDKPKWSWEKELQIWEAPITISIGIKEILNPKDKEKLLMRIKVLTFEGGEFKIPDNIFSALLRIKQ